MCADLKPSLIDLEAGDTATGRKLTLIKQRERLSERDTMYCVYWIRKETHTDVFSEGYVGISKAFSERMRYHVLDNKIQHRNATSVGTKVGIQNKDTTEARSIRAKQNHIKHAESYTNLVRGEKNPKAVLTEEQVKEIKYTLIPSGKTNKEIASLYSVKHYVISFIRTGKNWKHI